VSSPAPNPFALAAASLDGDRRIVTPADMIRYQTIDPARAGDTGPVGFVRHVLGIPADGYDDFPGQDAPFLWPHQQEILVAVWTYDRTSVASCHAIGKDWTAALAALTFLQVFEPSIVITTGPTDRQVRLLLWGEIAAHFHRSRTQLRGKPNQTELRLAPQHYAVGFKSKDTAPERFAGFHSPHILYVIDEASGVPDAIYEAIEGGMSTGDARILQIGNPLQAGGQFYRAHHNERGLWHCIEVDYTQTPNYAGVNPDGSWIVPPREEVKARYFIQPSWAETMRQKWTEDNPLYQARVRGRFPVEGINTLISMLWVLQAIDAPLDTRQPWQPTELGLDVARYGGDESSMFLRQGRNYVHHESWSQRDTMFTASKVMRAILDFDVRVARIDVIGMGAGVFDRLIEMQDEGKVPDHVRLVAVNVAESTTREQAHRLHGEEFRDPDYEKLRDEVWWGLRETLRNEGILGLPRDEVLMGQLCGVMYDLKSGRLKVEKKEEMSKRGLGSPDRAEAMMLACINDALPIAEEDGALDDIEDLPEDAMYAAGLMTKSF
jgi:hypothetical protein